MSGPDASAARDDETAETAERAGGSGDPYGMLGIARRAGALAIGAESAAAAVRVRQAQLVVLAQDAGRHTRSRFQTVCRAKEIPLARFGTREGLGQAIGRPPTAVVAVTERHLAAGFDGLLDAAVPAGGDERDERADGR